MGYSETLTSAQTDKAIGKRFVVRRLSQFRKLINNTLLFVVFVTRTVSKWDIKV